MSDLVFFFTDSEDRKYRFELYENVLGELCVKKSCDHKDSRGFRYSYTMRGKVDWESETLPEDARRFLERVVKNLAFA